MTLLLAVLAALGAALLLVGARRVAQTRVEALHAMVRGPSLLANLTRAPTPRAAGAPIIRLPPVLRYLESRMKQAGVDWPVSSILSLIVGTGAVAAALAFAVTGVPWVTCAAFLGGFYAPVWRLGRLAHARAVKVARQLDQVCTELIQAVSGGLDLVDAIGQQARKAPDPLGAELARMYKRVKGEGDSFADVARELGERIDLEEARLLALGLRLSKTEGTQVVPVLQSVLHSLRGRRELQGLVHELGIRDQQQSLILIVIPLVLFPVLRYAAPGFTAPLFHTLTGQILLVADLGWMLFGIQIIRSWFGSVRT